MSYEFKNNKYYFWYINLINYAKQYNRKKGKDSYYENHHIIPKSLGGSNKKFNLVLLTAREHLIAHLLLVRIVQNNDIYRMVNAIRRFKTNTHNSRHFESIRRTISKYSFGDLNPSYGKIWIHNIHTKEVTYIQLSEFEKMDNLIFKKGLPNQRGGFSKGRIWVNNINEESLIEPDSLQDYIVNGWQIGRISIPTTEHMILMASKRHTPEKDLIHSQNMSGPKHFNYGKRAFNKGRIWMNDGIISKMVSVELLQTHTDNGWIKGRLPQ